MSTAPIRFTQGIPGFEHLHEFVFQALEGDPSVRLMESVEDRDISFMVMNPFYLYPDYEWALPQSVQEELEIVEENELEIWSIITIPTDISRASINLLAPLVINYGRMLGKQIILHDSPYSSRAPLFGTSDDQSVRG